MQRRWRIHEIRGDVIVARRTSLDDGARSSRTAGSLRSDLIRWLAEPTTRSVLLAMYESVETDGIGTWARRISRRELDTTVIERLCAAFARGELSIVTADPSSARGDHVGPRAAPHDRASHGDPAPSRVAPSRPEPPSQPALPNDTTTWIEIELYDTEQRPVAGRRYRITLPDGSIREGRLDAAGHARVSGIDDPGTCKVAFPELDRREWQRA